MEEKKEIDEEVVLELDEIKEIMSDYDEENETPEEDKIPRENKTLELFDDKENEIDVSNQKLENKTFGIQIMISDFEYRLRGFIWKANGEKFVYSGNPLAGKKTIQKIILLLDPFSKSINMIGNKQNYTWQKQLLRTRLAVASVLTNAYDSDLKNFKEIWRTFSNLMFNIGDVILEKNSKEMLEKYFGIGEDYANTGLSKKIEEGGF